MTRNRYLLILSFAFFIPALLIMKFYRPDRLGNSTQEFVSHLQRGGTLKGKTIWVRAEWNLGDTMQFLRYVRHLKQMGATIILEPQKPLTQLTSLCPYVDTVIEKGTLARTVDRISCLCPCIGVVLPEKRPNQHVDFVVSLARLPVVFESVPQLKSVINKQFETPYLYADPQLVNHWKEKLSHDIHRLKIGICWFGDSRHNPERFVPLRQLAEIALIAGVQLYGLQKHHGLAQLDQLPHDIIIHTFGKEFDQEHGSFMDTAAIMKNLDLVITVDTSIAHLAGGLGVPVWTLLPHEPEWRWRKDKTSAWHPSYSNMRVFLQPSSGDWNTVIKTVMSEIKNMIKSDT